MPTATIGCSRRRSRLSFIKYFNLLLSFLNRHCTVFSTIGKLSAAKFEMAENEKTDEKMFKFFDLSRELRNEVYTNLTKYLCVSSGYDEVHEEPIRAETYTADAPIPHLFRLCRQFKTEYEETFKQGFTIIFRDIGSMDYEPALEGDLDRYTKAEVFVLAYCDDAGCPGHKCGAYYDLRDHVGWIEKMLPSLQNLRDLRVRVYQCQSHDSSVECAPVHPPMQLRDHLDRLVKLATLSRLEVYPFVKVEGSGNAADGVVAYESAQAPEKVWTKEDGWQ